MANTLSGSLIDVNIGKGSCIQLMYVRLVPAIYMQVKSLGIGEKFEKIFGAQKLSSIFGTLQQVKFPFGLHSSISTVILVLVILS